MRKKEVFLCLLLAGMLFSLLTFSCCAGGESLLDAYGMDLDLFLTYLDVSGEEMSIYPAAAGAEGDTVLLWGYLPDSTVEEVTLHVSDVNGLYTFSPDEGTDLQVIDAGMDQNGKPLCEIIARSEDGETVQIRLYLSLSVSEPVVPEEEDPLQDAEEEPQKRAILINVHFVDEEGNPVAPDRTETVWTGQLDAVYADPIEGYVRVGDVAQMVFLPLGTTAADDVTFVYQSILQEEPDGVPEDGTIPEVVEPENAGPEFSSETEENIPEFGFDVPENREEPDLYPQSQDVTGENQMSDQSGPESVPEQTPVPAPAVKLIQVVYSYENDLYGYSSSKLEPVSEGETLLFAEEPKDGYRLEGEDAQLVTVYSDGTAEPDTVVFTYVRIPEQTEEPGFQTGIPVYYQTEDGTNVATPTEEIVYVGTQLVYANPVGLKDGYDLVTGPQEVTCGPDGTLTPSRLVFIYRPSDDGSEEIQDGKNDFSLQPYSGYAKALRTVNLRSYPDQADSGNIIGTISADDLIILQQITNYKNSNWYYVSVNGRMGYVSTSVVRELTESETALLENIVQEDETPDEVQEEPGLIERWGKTTAKLRFRAEPNGKVIRELKKNSDIFVLSEEERDQVLWYKALAFGQTGWVMADYVELYTVSQSALKQSQVKTPVPTHTPQMTRVPTATPTLFIPTPTPAAEVIPATPAPSPTPVPYSGYGLSIARAAVRSSLSLKDESVREMIAVDTLLSIQGQTYVDGVCWDSVRVLSSGVTGFMQDDQIRRISDSEADYYIASLATPTPAPVILSTPEPFSGMARTLGDYVPLRTDMSSNAQIIDLLVKDSVMQVYEQETSANGLTWCLVQYGQDIGYVRRDMIVQMNDWEIAGYIASLRSPTPTPVSTPAPVVNSLRATAYGIINRDRVNLRQEATVSSLSLYMMTRNEMGYIMDTVQGDDGKDWYFITVSGRTGYVCSDYMTILTQNELDDFLNTEDFRSANNSENLISDSASLYSYEDHLQEQWQNTSPSASFEPFNPYETPNPVSGAATYQPVSTPAPTLPPAPSPTIVGGFLRDGEEAGQNTDNGLSTGVILLALGGAVILIGTSVILARGSKRRKMQRQALRRAQRAQSVQRSRRANGEPYEQDSRTSRYHRDGASAPYDSYGDRADAPPADENEIVYRPSRRREDELGETRRTDAPSRYRIERTAQPYRPADETVPFSAADREEDDTAMFRRPVRPYTERTAEYSERANESTDADLEIRQEEDTYLPENDSIPDRRTASSSRRRRTEHFRDEQ